MKLRTLLTEAGYDAVSVSAYAETEITGVCCDTRSVGEGSLFVALRGRQTDGHCHVPRASERGAVFAVTEYETNCSTLPSLRVPDTREALARLSDAFYGHPARGMRIVGVTGTNGKTSVLSILTHLLSKNGGRVGTVGTVGATANGKALDMTAPDPEAHMTTPDPPVLYRLLRAMRDDGCDTVVMEATSHAAVLKKLTPLTFSLLIFTNLTGDHLDFHGSPEAYFLAKASLFERAERALVNLDGSAVRGDPNGYGARIAEIAKRHGAEVRTCSEDVRKDPDFLLFGFTERLGTGIALTMKTKDGGSDLPLRSRLLGKYSGMNLLVSAAAAQILGAEPQGIAAAMETFPGVPGRMEELPLGADFSVFIDFAHTPDALENLLRAVHGFRKGKGRITVLFGCGGDRDPYKRKEMAIVASRMADLIYVTSDNSRSEDPNNIIKEILKGIDKEKPCRVIPSRREAIEAAIADARTDDILLLCGKGHERYTVDRDGIHAFSEPEIVKEAFRKRQNGRDGGDAT